MVPKQRLDQYGLKALSLDRTILIFMAGGCAKGLSVTGASIITAVGLAGIAISIYVFVNNKQWTSIVGNYLLSFAVLFIVVSCLVTLTGALGIFGACYDNKCLLHTFWILLTIWMLGFIAAGVVAVILPNKIFEGGCTNTNFVDFAKLDTRYNSASGTLCRSGCQCYVADGTQASILTYNFTITDTTQAHNVQACSGWTSTNTDSIFAGIELALSCSGWCSTPPQPGIFYFSNNDNASRRPTDYCYSAFSNWFAKYGQVVYISSFVFAGFCLILIGCTWAYICQINEHSK